MVNADCSASNISSHDKQEHDLKGLFPGSRFQGTQRSGRSSYDVEVEVQDVDLDRFFSFYTFLVKPLTHISINVCRRIRSFLCGYLRISGLTEEYPVLTTYFEAEIVGKHYSFITGKWVRSPPSLVDLSQHMSNVHFFLLLMSIAALNDTEFHGRMLTRKRIETTGVNFRPFAIIAMTCASLAAR